MPTLKNLVRRDCLRRLTGVKYKKFQKLVIELNPSWEAAQKRKHVTGRPYEIGGLREHLLLLLMYYRTYTTYLFLAKIFQVDEATICRAIRRVAPLAMRFLEIKPERILEEEELDGLIVDATEQRIYRPKNQRDYYSGKKRAHTIKTEMVITLNGLIFRVSQPHPGSEHDFAMRKAEGALPDCTIFADLGYQGLQNIHSGTVFIPKKRPRNGSLTEAEKAENKRLARRRILVEHVFAHLKKWQILAACYRGHLANYGQIFQIIAGLHNFLKAA